MTTCRCGCGETPAGGGDFLPGHDQKLRIQLEKRAGGLLGLADLVDLADRFVDGSLSMGDYAIRTRQIMGPRE